MKRSVKEIADILNGDIVGDPDVEVSEIAPIEVAQKGSVSFLSNPQYTHFLYQTNASVVLVDMGFSPTRKINCTLIRVKNVYEKFAQLQSLFNGKVNGMKGVSHISSIHKSAIIGREVYIGPYVFVDKNAIIADKVKIYSGAYIGENVKIGAKTVIFPGVIISHDCCIGENCIIHPGSVIGSDGFGFAPDKNGSFTKVPQNGHVMIENDVEIGANCTIDRGTVGATVIKKGAKLDNLIQVAHNVEIGENTVIAAQSGIAGSSIVGNNCMLGGQVGIVGHIKIADYVKIGAQAGVGSGITHKGAVVLGSPAMDKSKFNRSYVMFRKLPDISNRIDQLEQEIIHLKTKLEK